MASNDDLPFDELSLEEVEAVKREFGLEDKQARAMILIRKGVPIKKIVELFTEEMWLREVAKDLEGWECHACKKHTGAARSKAIQLLGEWMGIIGGKSKKKAKREVTFGDE